ncbi:hypothetical protein P7K49_023120 [Saguinus oedipus]|uniref:Uncharacterized protein n=1 Tax=Saguinus oedipus TaxID=9490 RepID=A0ABQ9UKS4_SAGOE|nr:hypothetical protein P7K49_023120 [Saguinus oedipus]
MALGWSRVNGGAQAPPLTVDFATPTSWLLLTAKMSLHGKWASSRSHLESVVVPPPPSPAGDLKPQTPPPAEYLNHLILLFVQGDPIKLNQVSVLWNPVYPVQVSVLGDYTRLILPSVPGDPIRLTQMSVLWKPIQLIQPSVPRYLNHLILLSVQGNPIQLI